MTAREEAHARHAEPPVRHEAGHGHGSRRGYLTGFLLIVISGSLWIMYHLGEGQHGDQYGRPLWP